MLHSFTWQQFLVAAITFSSIWYLTVFLLYYRRKTSGTAAHPASEIFEPLPHAWDDEFEEDENESLIGSSAVPEGISNVSMGQFAFASGNDNREYQLGMVPDVIEELKRIVSILAKEDGSKTDFFSLLQLVKAKYPKIGSSPSISNINNYIREHLPFHLTNDEIENLWD